MKFSLNSFVSIIVFFALASSLAGQSPHSSSCRFPVAGVPPSLETAPEFLPERISAAGVTSLRQEFISYTEADIRDRVNPQKARIETHFTFDREGRIIQLKKDLSGIGLRSSQLELFYLPSGKARNALYYQELESGRDSLTGTDTVLYFEGGKIIECWSRRPCEPSEDCFWPGTRYTYSAPGGDLLQTDWMQCEKTGEHPQSPCMNALPLQRSIFVYDDAHRVSETEYYQIQNQETDFGDNLRGKVWTPVLLHYTQFTYDAQGRIVSHQVFDGEGELTETALYVYNAAGQLEQIRISPAVLTEEAPQSSLFTFYYLPSGLLAEKHASIKFAAAERNLTMKTTYHWK